MKAKFFLLALIFCSFSLQAQKQNTDCLDKAQQYEKLIVENKYDEAFGIWETVAKNCPKLNESIYLSGEKIFVYKIDNATNTAGKLKLVEGLLKMYDVYDTHFPANKNGNTIKKALLTYQNKLGTDEEIYLLFDKAFAKSPESFTTPTALDIYFGLFYDRFTAGKEKGVETVFEKQGVVLAQLQKFAESATPATAREAKIAIDNVNGRVSDIATCDNLIPFYKKTFEAKKNDVAWLESAAALLVFKNCTHDPMFLQIAEAQHKLKPTSKSAYNIGLAALRNRNQEKAVEYFNISADLNTNNAEKARTYYSIATTIYGNSDKAKSKEFLKKAMATDPAFGKPYLFLAQLYANETQCGQTPFEKKAIYWLAAETAKKAGAVEAKIQEAANKTVTAMKGKAPSEAEIKESKMAGKTITFGCWINESVIVPKS